MTCLTRRCEPGPLRWLWLALLAVVSISPPAAADDEATPPPPQPIAAPVLHGSPDFLFGAPRAWWSIRGSLFVPRAGGDLFDFVRDQLTLDRGDFRAGGMATDVGVAVSPNVDIVGGFDLNRREAGSEYRHLIASNLQPITQRTRLNETALSAGVRYAPLGRGRSISRYAFIPRRLVPYVGAGATIGFHHFEQRGQFVDYNDQSVFTDRFSSDGWTAGPYVHGGADVQVWKRLFVTFDGRYTWLHADLGSDFSGFDGIDLAGFRGGTGISIVF